MRDDKSLSSLEVKITQYFINMRRVAKSRICVRDDPTTVNERNTYHYISWFT